MASSRRPAPPVHEIGAYLSDVEPAVWRRVRMSSGTTLGRAGRVIAAAMGWATGRPYAFTVGPLRYEGKQVANVWQDVVDVRLRQILPDTGSELEFEYGTDHIWHFVLRLERIHPPNGDNRKPVCVAGDGASPPLDVGGPWAYAEWRFDEERHYSGSDAPEALLRPGFNIDAVNAALAELVR